MKNKEKISFETIQKDEETIKDLTSKIIKLGGKPNFKNKDLKSSIKELTHQFEKLSIENVLQNKDKNIINDEVINDTKVRFQKIQDLHPKYLRKLVDKGKKELTEGIVIIFASKNGKVGLAVGITDNLTNKFDAVKFVKVGSEVIGGKGGGGRKDFAQAGGQDETKIEAAYKELKTLI